MEKIEQCLDLPRINATIIARNKDNLAFLKTLLFEEKSPDDKTEYGWYLHLTNPGPNRRYNPAWVELDPDEVQFLQNNLKKALHKLIILETVKINGLYTLNLDGIKNLRLEVKSDGNYAWLEFILYSSTKKKFVTSLVTSEVRAMHQKLRGVQVAGENLVRQLEKIQSLSGHPQIHLPIAPTLEEAQLARHLEALVKKSEKTMLHSKPGKVTEKVTPSFWSKLRSQ